MLVCLDSEPNHAISALTGTQGAFFSSTHWQRHLQASFNTKSLYFYDTRADDGMVVQVFQRGPFRVAYLNFPVGGTIRQLEPTIQNIDSLKAYLRQYSIHRLRIRQSAFRTSSSLPGKPVVELETAVTNLQAYDGSKIDKVRRSLAKAQRFDVRVSENSDVSAQYLFDTYTATINRHGGRHRYPRQYFSSLVNLNKAQQKLRILIAEKNEKPVGFLVSTIETETAYYLHGGVSAQGRKYNVSDVLMDQALSISRDQGVYLFNLMASPPNQPSLVKFKEKFGSETREHKTYDFSISRLWDGVIRILEKVT